MNSLEKYQQQMGIKEMKEQIGNVLTVINAECLMLTIFDNENIDKYKDLMKMTDEMKRILYSDMN